MRTFSGIDFLTSIMEKKFLISLLQYQVFSFKNSDTLIRLLSESDDKSHKNIHDFYKCKILTEFI